MSSRKAVSRLVHRGHIPDHTWRVRRAHRARRAAERDFCRTWQPGDDFDPAASGRGQYRPICRSDKSGNPVRKEAFYGLLRQMVGLDWDTIKVELTRRFGRSNLGRRSLRSLFFQIEQGKTPFTVEAKSDGVVLSHHLGPKSERVNGHRRSNQRFVDDWDMVLVDDEDVGEEPFTDLGLTPREAEVYEREYDEDEDTYDSYDVCLCDDCRDQRAAELENERLEWEREDRERELEAQIDDAGPEDFGFPAYEPRPDYLTGGTYRQPAEKGWRGPQWARHKHKFNPRSHA